MVKLVGRVLVGQFSPFPLGWEGRVEPAPTHLVTNNMDDAG